MIVDMVFYPLTTWERRTYVRGGSFSPNESGMWPTPTAHDKSSGNPKRVNRFGTKHGGRNLNDWAVMWPTPKASDAEKNQRTLAGIQKEVERKGSLPDLISAVKLWTTPVADDSGHRKKPYAQGGTALSTPVGGQLNPTWVEWLMGYPTGWTELSALGMQWCPPKRKKLSKD
jgi:hypothetical protein